MKKRLWTGLAALCIISAAIFALTACAGTDGDNTNISAGTEITADDFVYGQGIYSLTTPNATEEISFADKITIADGSVMKVFIDKDCMYEVDAAKVPLAPGDNRFYIRVDNGKFKRHYEFKIRRKPIYTVTFAAAGLIEVAPQFVEEDGFATEPEVPIVPGYTYSWVYNFAYPIKSDLTIKTKRELVEYEISYDLGGGAFKGDYPTTYTIEDELTLPAPVRDYYDFVGWSDGGNIEKGTTGNRTFTAEYAPITYKITYDVWLGENAEDNAATYTIESETIELNDAYYLSADFLGWEYGGKRITEIPAGSHGDMKITALWDKYDVELELNPDGKSFKVKGIGHHLPDIVNIKSEYKGLPVTGIGRLAFAGAGSGLTAITIPESVTEIGSRAFQGCSSLTGITLPSGVTRIPQGTFGWCYGLTELPIGPNIRYIGESAFANCLGLKNVTIPDNVTEAGSNIFAYCVNLERAKLPSTWTEVPSGTFMGCTSLNDVKLPLAATKISGGAFSKCTSLNGISIPSGVTSIGSEAFKNCTALEEIKLPSGLTQISDKAFLNCVKITGITIPAAVTYVNDSAFEGCAIKTATIPALACAAIKSSALESVTIAGGESIEANALANCENLTDATIASGITSIGLGAFSGCAKLTNLSIGESVTSIDGFAFSGCSALENLLLGNGVTSIGSKAFEGCESLTKLTIPSNVTKIGDCAFRNCSKLTELTILSGEINGTYDIFQGCAIERLTIPAMRFIICVPKSALKTLVITGGESIPKNAFFNSANLTDVTIAEGVKNIGMLAFHGCTGLKSITLPDSVTNIEDKAFYECANLTGIDMPAGLESIGADAFYGCGSLTGITIPAAVTSIGEFAFYGCDALESVVFENTEGWSATRDGKTEEISSDFLADPSIAVRFVRSTGYGNYTWSRSIDGAAE